jgi:hypothetical protein
MDTNTFHVLKQTLQSGDSLGWFQYKIHGQSE